MKLFLLVLLAFSMLLTNAQTTDTSTLIKRTAPHSSTKPFTLMPRYTFKPEPSYLNTKPLTKAPNRQVKLYWDPFSLKYTAVPVNSYSKETRFTNTANNVAGLLLPYKQ